MNQINYFKNDLIPEDLMSPLVEAIMDELKKKNLGVIEAYDFYANKLHLKLFERPEVVCNRLSKGYESLLIELVDLK